MLESGSIRAIIGKNYEIRILDKHIHYGIPNLVAASVKQCNIKKASIRIFIMYGMKIYTNSWRDFWIERAIHDSIQKARSANATLLGNKCNL